MAAKKASGPVCECGEVIFDLTGKKPGSVLRCPWCHNRYRVEEGGSVTRLPDMKEETSPKAGKDGKPSTRSRMKPASRAEPELDDEDEDEEEDEDDGGEDDEEDEDEAEDEDDDGQVDEEDEDEDEEEEEEEHNDSEVIEEEKVEVFSFDSEEKEEEPADRKKDRPASKARLDRPRDAASDPTVPLERISRRRTRGQQGDESARSKGDVAPRSRSSRPRVAAADPTEPLNRISRRTRKEEPLLDENGQPIDELPPSKPLDLEKWVFRMALGMVPVGTVVFMAWVIYGVYSGQRDFVTYRIFGLTIRGDNPWVWFAGIVMGGLLFLGMWVGYVYFFVHKKKQIEMEKKRRKEQEGGGPASGRRSTRRYGEAADE